jgi:hypothetical protein
LNAHPLERPQVFIGGAGEKVENGLFIDEDTVTLIKDLVEKLAAWAVRLRK